MSPHIGPFPVRRISSNTDRIPVPPLSRRPRGCPECPVYPVRMSPGGRTFAGGRCYPGKRPFHRRPKAPHSEEIPVSGRVRPLSHVRDVPPPGPDDPSWQTSSGSYRTPNFRRRRSAHPGKFAGRFHTRDPGRSPTGAPKNDDLRSGDTSAPPALVASRYSVTPTSMDLRPEAWQDPGDRYLPAWKRCPGGTVRRRHSTPRRNRPARLAPGQVSHCEPSRATCSRPRRSIAKRAEAPRPAGFIHVRGSFSPWSRTPPANFTVFETPEEAPACPGRPAKHRTRAPGTREQTPGSTPCRDRPHFQVMAFSTRDPERGSIPRMGSYRFPRMGISLPRPVPHPLPVRPEAFDQDDRPGGSPSRPSRRSPPSTRPSPLRCLAPGEDPRRCSGEDLRRSHPVRPGPPRTRRSGRSRASGYFRP